MTNLQCDLVVGVRHSFSPSSVGVEVSLPTPEAADPYKSDRSDIFARSSKAPMNARWRTWSKLAYASGVPPVIRRLWWRKKIELAEGQRIPIGQAVAKQCFSRARREHDVTQSVPVLHEVEQSINDAVRSIGRVEDTAGPSCSTPSASMKMDECQWPRTHAIFVTGTWFLIRDS